MAQHGVHVEFGMAHDAPKVLEQRLPGGTELDQLVIGARQHAVGGGEHKVTRQRDTARGAARADQQHHGAAKFARRRCAPHDCPCGREQRDHEESGKDAPHRADQACRTRSVNAGAARRFVEELHNLYQACTQCPPSC
jgi:hypothetical protein